MLYTHNIFIASTLNQLNHVLEVAYSIEMHSNLNYIVNLMLDIVSSQTNQLEMRLSKLQFKHVRFKILTSQVLDELLSPFNSKLNFSLTKMTYARLVLFTDLILNADKVIYLDTDVIIYNQSFDELASIQFDNNVAIAACDDLPVQLFDQRTMNICKCRYFNAGVMIINMSNASLRRNILNKIRFFLDDETSYNYCDQGILNLLAKDCVQFIDPKFNVLDMNLGYPFYEEYAKQFGYQNTQDLITHGAIVHCAGLGKPWNPNIDQWQPWQIPYRQWYVDLYHANKKALYAHCSAVGALLDELDKESVMQ